LTARWGIIFGVVGVLAFSVRPILIKLSYAQHPVSPATLLFVRMAIALPFFAAVAWWLRGAVPRLAPRDWAAVAGLGVLGYYVASFLDFLGLQWVGAGLGRLILFLYPTLVLLLSFVFLQRRPTGNEIVALALSYLGIGLVVSSRLAAPQADGRFALGAALIFGGALAYAIYLVASSQIVRRVGSMRFTAWSMVFAAAPAAIQFALLEPLSALELPPAVWHYAFLLGTLCTVLPVFLVAEALKRIGPNRMALIGAVGPVSAAFLGAVGLDEPFTWVQAVGSLLAIGGVLLVSMRISR
jgi:drug/metabolite transporter (DMT)-like permease